LSFERLSHFFSLLKERIMARKFGFLFLGVCLVMNTLGFFGCKSESEDGQVSSLVGSWKSEAGDGLDISETTFSYKSSDPTWGMDYSGEIVGAVLADKSLLNAQWGYLTFKVTASGEWGPTVGKYFVIHWKELTPTTVMESGAYKADGQNSGMDTAAAAASEYTAENGYFGVFGAYSRQ
jgi:hypothetical protein